MDYFKFTEEDLQANRNGKFSEAQKQKYSVDQKVSFKLGVRKTVCCGFIAFGLLGGAAYMYIAHKVTGNNGGIPVSMIVGGIIALIVTIFLFRSLFVKHQFKLAKAEGPVNIIKAERTSTDTDLADGMSHTSPYFAYELHIGGEEFDVDEDLADVMMQGDTYAIYYSEGSEIDILSAELISKAN